MTNENSRLLPTSVVGSYAQPGWYAHAVDGVRNGAFGPFDREELLADAVDTAIRDQEDAGLDLISDGEMRRIGQGFFTAAFYQRFPGLEAVDHTRKLGKPGHDQQHKYRATRTLEAPDGLGVVEEWRYASKRAQRPVKALLPGPFTLAGRILHGDGETYRTREAIAWDMAGLLNAEIARLAEAGAPFIQLDEPSPAIHPGEKAPFARLLNACFDGVAGIDRARRAVHLCFGNNLGRPVSKRKYAPVLDEIGQFAVDQLLLEFANRELDELELCAELAREREIAAGVLDVKNYYVESPEDIAERIRKTLEHVPPEKLWLIPDCGFSETARFVARRKLFAMSEGARIVRQELTGEDEPSVYEDDAPARVSQMHNAPKRA